MGSFQQVVMGGICLVAVFWFGSFINQQPAALQQPLQRFSNATVGTGTSQIPSQLAAKPQGGLLSTLFQAPAKPRPVTLSDLKSRSTPNLSNVVAQNSGTPFVAAQEQYQPERMIDSATEVVSDFVNPPVPGIGDRSFVANDFSDRFVPNNHSAHVVSNNTLQQQPLEIMSNKHSDQNRLEIVPDFSTLAQDFRREQAAQYQRNDQVAETPAVSGQLGSMLPVPKLDDFSRASFGQPLKQPNRDWNAVRQGVLSVEDKLKQFHQAHPVAEEFEPLRSEPLRSAESRFPVAAQTTSGRFIPEALSRRQQLDRRQQLEQEEVERLEISLQEYERQELERQEAQRQEFRKRRPQAFIPNSSWSNSDGPTVVPIPRNQLRTENQLTGRGDARVQRFEPSYRPAPKEFDRPAPSESLAQRQERWKVFGDRTSGDRTRDPESALDTRPDARNRADYRSAQPRSAAQVRPAEVRSIPEASRVRSLYSMPMEDETRLPERTARQQDRFVNQKKLQPSPQRSSSESLANDSGPEVIRYGDFKTYVTEGGDTLQTISESFFGTPEYYFDLYLANRNVLVNPATVPAGVELRIPRMGE